MTRFELADKILGVTETEHTSEEWKQLYQELAGEFSDFCKLEECMENVIAVQFGEDQLRMICAKALEQLETMEKDKANISQEDIEMLSEILN